MRVSSIYSKVSKRYSRTGRAMVTHPCERLRRRRKNLRLCHSQRKPPGAVLLFGNQPTLTMDGEYLSVHTERIGVSSRQSTGTAASERPVCALKFCASCSSSGGMLRNEMGSGSWPTLVDREWMRFEKAGLELHANVFCRINPSFAKNGYAWKGQNESASE
jgi:hypothetical protein